MKTSEIVKQIHKLKIDDDEKTKILNRLADLFQVIAKTCYEGVSVYQGSIKRNNWLDFVVNEIYHKLATPISYNHFITILRVQVLVGLNQITTETLLEEIKSSIADQLQPKNKDRVVNSIKELLRDSKVEGEKVKSYWESGDYNKLLDKLSELDIFYVYLMYLVNSNTIGDIIKSIPNKIQEIKIHKEEKKTSKSKAIDPASVITSKSKAVRVKGVSGIQEKPLQPSSATIGSGEGPKSQETKTEQTSGSQTDDLTEILKGFQKLYSNIPILKKLIESSKLGKKRKSEFENIIAGLTKFIALSQSKQAELKQDLHSQLNRNISDIEQELEKQRKLHEFISKSIQNSYDIIKYQNYIIQDLLKLIEKTQELNKYKTHLDFRSIDADTLRAILRASKIKDKGSETKESETPSPPAKDINKAISDIVESETINNKTVEKFSKEISKLNKISKKPQKLIKLDDVLDDLSILAAKQIDPDKPIQEPIREILKKFPKSIAELVRNVRKGVSKPIDILIQKLGGRTLRKITGLGHIQDNVSLKAIADKVVGLLTPALPIPKYLSRMMQNLKNLKYYNLARRSAKVVAEKIKSSDQAKMYKDIEKIVDKNKEFYSKNYLGRRILFGIASAIGPLYRNSVEKTSMINKILETLFGVKPLKTVAVLRFKRLNKISKTKTDKKDINDVKPDGTRREISQPVAEKRDVRKSKEAAKSEAQKTAATRQAKSFQTSSDKPKEKGGDSGKKLDKPKGLTFSSKRVVLAQESPDLISYAEIRVPKNKEVRKEIQEREKFIDDDFMREYILSDIEMNEALARMLSEGASDRSSSDTGGESMGNPASALNNIGNAPDEATTVTNQSGSMISRLSNKFSSKLKSFRGELGKGVSKVIKPIKSVGGKFAKAFKVAGSRLAGIASSVFSKLLRGVPIIGWLTLIWDVLKTAWNVTVVIKAMAPKVQLGYDKLLKNKEEELYKSINEAYNRAIDAGGYQRIIENIRGEGKARENIGEYALVRDRQGAPMTSGAVTKPKDISLAGAEGISKENAPKPIERYGYQPKMETGFHSFDPQYKELLESNIAIQKQTIDIINQLNSTVAYTDTKATTNAMRQIAAEEQKSSTKVVSGNKVYGFRKA